MRASWDEHGRKRYLLNILHSGRRREATRRWNGQWHCCRSHAAGTLLARCGINIHNLHSPDGNETLPSRWQRCHASLIKVQIATLCFANLASTLCGRGPLFKRRRCPMTYYGGAGERQYGIRSLACMTSTSIGRILESSDTHCPEPVTEVGLIRRGACDTLERDLQMHMPLGNGL